MVARRVEVTGSERLENNLRRLRVNIVAELTRDGIRFINDAHLIVMRNTPVVTGETRRSYQVLFRPDYRAGSEGFSAEVRPRRNIYPYITLLERKYHMFARAQLFLNTRLETRVAEAVRRAINRTFG